MCLGLSIATAAENTKSNIFDEFSRQIIIGLDQAKPLEKNDAGTDSSISYIEKAFNYTKGAKLRIAVWPFDEDQIPVSNRVAKNFNRKLLSALLRQSNNKFEFKARDALTALISDMQATGSLDAVGGNPIAGLIKNAGDIDVLIKGDITLDRDEVSLSYQAVHVDSKILASTDLAQIKLSRSDLQGTGKVYTLDQAVRAAAKELSNKAHNMSELRLGGIRFQASGSQPTFGTYLQAQVSTHLQNAFENSLSDRKLRVLDNLNPIYNVRGMGVDAKKMSDKNASDDPSSYLMTGSYWSFEESVEVRVRLKNSIGDAFSWSGHIRKDTIGGMQIRPANNFMPLRKSDGLGPIAFSLTTSRGEDPAYHVGEKMNIILRVDRDAWVYCFYHQANRETIQIFPNPHFWSVMKEPKLKGGIVNTIPGDQTFPFDLNVQPPLGEELLKCFATSKDVTSKLPKPLRGLSLEPMKRSVTENLSNIFRSLEGVAVSEASVAVTVVQ